jgi:hypothetical protein
MVEYVELNEPSEKAIMNAVKCLLENNREKEKLYDVKFKRKVRTA